MAYIRPNWDKAGYRVGRKGVKLQDRWRRPVETVVFFDDLSTYADTAALQASWTAISTTLVTLDAGRMRAENADTFSARVVKQIAVEAGRKYRIYFTNVVDNVSSWRIWLGTTSQGQQIRVVAYTDNTEKFIDFTAPSDSLWVTFLHITATAGAFITIDNVRVVLRA